MVVSVQFIGALRTITKTGEIQIPLAKDGRVCDVLGYLMDSYPHLPLSEQGILVTVNNKASDINHILNPNDSIIFLPHVGGG